MAGHSVETFSAAAPDVGLFDDITAFCADVPEGGAVCGYVGYEAANSLLEGLDLPPSPDRLPVVHLEKVASVLPVMPGTEGSKGPTPRAVVRPGADVFEPKVAAVIDDILRGEIFQANISRRLSARFAGGLEIAPDLFCKLIGAAPAPYAGFVPTNDGAVLSNSPELFLKVKGGHVAAEPIKGTAPRHADPAADRAAAEALEASEKDRAENIMIADLLRNDLAKVCLDHSIREPAICALRSLPAVHHLYSRIEGELREGLGPIDALAAAFPCGSITGAPKHRAMQVIARLEEEGRGPYCGSLVYIPHDGPAVFSVAIRTAVLSREDGGMRLDYRAGGGITALSVPSAEYAETVDKAYGFEAMVR